MRKQSYLVIICAAFTLTACATVNQPKAPDLKGQSVVALNPTKWDHAEAVKRRQDALSHGSGIER